MNMQNSQNTKDSSIVKFNFIFTDRDASVVIGRGGSIIKDIIDKTNCKLAVNGQQGMERYLTVSGKVLDVPKAVYLVADILSKRINVSDDLDSQSANTSIIMLLLLPIKLCGAVIGKKGENVKTIMENSKARILVYFDSLTNSGERTTKIEGNPRAIEKAMEVISKMFAEVADDEDMAISSSHSESSKQTNSGILAGMTLRTTQTLSLDTEIAKLIIGKNGNNINEIRSISRANVKVENSQVNQHESVVTLSGNPSSVAVALHLIQAKIGSFVNQKSRFNNNGKKPEFGIQKVPFQRSEYMSSTNGQSRTIPRAFR